MSADAEIIRDLGSLEARVTRLEQDVQEIKADVRVIRDAIVTAKGGWKTLILVGTAVAGITTLVVKFFDMWVRH